MDSLADGDQGTVHLPRVRRDPHTRRFYRKVQLIWCSATSSSRSLTVNRPVSVSVHVLAEWDHPKILDVHGIVLIRRSKNRCFGFVGLLLLALVFDFPGEVDGVLDLGEVKLPVDQLAHERELHGAVRC